MRSRAWTCDVALARRANPAVLRPLEAIHLASALLVDADVVLTYDQRLAAACVEAGLTVPAPRQCRQLDG